VSASLIFVVGPLAVLGSLSDGLGRGIDELALKSTLDGFASLVSAITATGGVLLLGVGLRLLAVKAVPVGDLLPALVVAPALARHWSRWCAEPSAAAAAGAADPHLR
jgi:uncharacterized membrane protein YqgA involved in biofilm formation